MTGPGRNLHPAPLCGMEGLASRVAGVSAALSFVVFAAIAALALVDGGGNYLPASVVAFSVGAASLIVRDISSTGRRGWTAK